MYYFKSKVVLTGSTGETGGESTLGAERISAAPPGLNKDPDILLSVPNSLPPFLLS